MNKGRLRDGSKKHICRRQACISVYIHLYTDFYELFAINICGLHHFVKSSSLRLGKSIVKQYIHFQKGVRVCHVIQQFIPKS